jgi:hypothetical protein
MNHLVTRQAYKQRRANAVAEWLLAALAAGVWARCAIRRQPAVTLTKPGRAFRRCARGVVMSSPRPPAFDTLSLHAGQRPDPVTGVRAVPLRETRRPQALGASAFVSLTRSGRASAWLLRPSTFSPVVMRFRFLAAGSFAFLPHPSERFIVTQYRRGKHELRQKSASLWRGVPRLEQ